MICIKPRMPSAPATLAGANFIIIKPVPDNAGAVRPGTRRDIVARAILLGARIFYDSVATSLPILERSSFNIRELFAVVSEDRASSTITVHTPQSQLGRRFTSIRRSGAVSAGTTGKSKSAAARFSGLFRFFSEHHPVD
jgi:hypothetical protein